MLLDKITSPEDLKTLTSTQLPQLCEELKRFVLESTPEKSGHILSSITVTELTVALHYVFNTPQDILVWDVGHQAYVHKVITDRKAIFSGNRKKGGISGFTARIESEFDPFGTGHSSTSISAVGGFSQSALLKNIERKHIAVIGDGALTGGMAYEALNHLGTSNLDVLVVLNDNESSIDPNVGALHEFGNYKDFFESLGWGYSGPIDGNNTDKLVRSLEAEKANCGPRMLHEKTVKRTLTYWKESLNIQPSSIIHHPSSITLYQDVFAQKLIELAMVDEKIVAISPAMLSGSSLTKFQEKFPNRCFDTGITEQHAVTFAAGLAADGMKPIVHLYSTFAQRAFDQILHDVALQNLPVVFALDRAGLVGEDGATHHGAFDLSFLNSVPNLQILAPMNAAELRGMLSYASEQRGPVVVRFPRGGEENAILEEQKIEKASFEVLQKGEKITVVSLGTIGQEVAKAVAELPNVGHINLRFLKPWNNTELKEVLHYSSTIITAEEGSMRGGLRDAMAAWASVNLANTAVKGIGLPDQFVAHATPEELAADFGLDADGIRLAINRLAKQ